jgi:(5-formylfuran-3-yl)methyl phosphate synthase
VQVLISPESIEEAISILDCKMDLLDVKNTAEGSLGAQFPWNTRQVVELAQGRGLTVSATLGDLPFKPGTAALAAYGCAMTGAGYIKAGLYGVTTQQEAFEMMDAIRRAVRMASPTAVVVAAGYADWRRFGGLNPDDLVDAARDAQCDLVMVDTAIKDGKTLFDNMTLEEIHNFVRLGHAAGLRVALAGSIKTHHTDALFETGADIVGVRGAVCEDSQNRRTRISPKKTNEFVELYARKTLEREAA